MSQQETTGQPGIERVLVVGAGTMGTEIAASFALAGYETTVSDISEDALTRSRETAGARLERQVAKHRLTAQARDAALALLTWSTDGDAAAASADFILEAASERLDIKRSLFARFGELAPAHAILATNSSTIPSSAIAEASGRPDRVCNLHFFNPALVMRCVEVVPNPETSRATLDTVLELSRSLGKEPVLLNTEVPGFVANRLMNAIQDEATRLLAAGVASAEDIDRAATLALGHPMGPFALMDLVGLDVISLMHQAEAQLTDDPALGPHPLLTAHVDAGELGRKTGTGWFSYTQEARA